MLNDSSAPWEHFALASISNHDQSHTSLRYLDLRGVLYDPIKLLSSRIVNTSLPIMVADHYSDPVEGLLQVTVKNLVDSQVAFNHTSEHHSAYVQFDAMVSEDAKTYGKLTVLPMKMNPDLSMGGDLLKKTKGSNLFMIFGEPDIEISREGEEVTVEIKGLDIYDPTTGSVRSSSTDDIACWFIDTDYDDESFFVRHAYFTGADRPFDKLKRTLRAEVDESVWESIYSTKSRPFPVPKSGKIAVKVINHYGDEVLSIHDVK
jgi:hypothetical protein